MSAQIHRQSTKGFTLVEIMLVVSMIAMLAAIAMPNYLRSRRRSQATVVLDGMRALESAISLYTVEHSRTGSQPISVADIRDFIPYLKTDSRLYQILPNDIFGNQVELTTLDVPPKISNATFAALSDAVPVEFWSPYYP